MSEFIKLFASPEEIFSNFYNKHRSNAFLSGNDSNQTWLHFRSRNVGSNLCIKRSKVGMFHDDRFIGCVIQFVIPLYNELAIYRKYFLAFNVAFSCKADVRVHKSRCVIMSIKINFLVSPWSHSRSQSDAPNYKTIICNFDHNYYSYYYEPKVYQTVLETRLIQDQNEKKYRLIHFFAAGEKCI